LYFFLFLLIFGLSLLLTGRLRAYALRRQLLDIPGQRSSHSQPTPRGGGLAIIASFLLLVLVAGWQQGFSPLLVALLGAACCVAILGFADDHGHIPAGWRLLGHLAAAVWAVYWLGLPQVSLFGIEPGVWLHVPVVLYLAWLLNLFNFMDGIDGIASLEAISVSLGALLVYWLSSPTLPLSADLLLGLVAATAGFLLWNLPPAKIFMGDVGSGTLGIILAIFALESSLHNPLWFWAWQILLAVFIADASYTLLRRLLRGEKVYQAHRSHAYQRAARALASHGRVSLAVALINLLWLLPLALLVVQELLAPLWGLLLAYLPLVGLAIFCGAGGREEQKS